MLWSCEIDPRTEAEGCASGWKGSSKGHSSLVAALKTCPPAPGFQQSPVSGSQVLWGFPKSQNIKHAENKNNTAGHWAVHPAHSVQLHTGFLHSLQVLHFGALANALVPWQNQQGQAG